MKMTKKDLFKLAKSLNAYWLGGNVYKYESDIYYLQHNVNDRELKKESKGYLPMLLDNINNFCEINSFKESYNLVASQIAYSAGLYGNSGQLHKLEIFDKKSDKKVKVLFVYYG